MNLARNVSCDDHFEDNYKKKYCNWHKINGDMNLIL